MGGKKNMKNMLRKTWLIGIVILFVGASVLPSISANTNEADTITRQAQAQPLMAFWEDNFDSYVLGSSMHGQGGWKGWDNDPLWTAYVSDVQSMSSPHSVDIAADSDLVHEYSGCTSGLWTYTVHVYVPSDLMGSSSFIMLSDYLDGAGQNNKWAVQTYFDSDQGIYTHDDGESLPLITNEWVEIRVEIDLDTDWHELYYDDDLLYEKAWTAGPFNAGDGILNIGAVDLFAALASSVYYDDMSLVGEATEPAISCEGDLDWVNVTAGETVTGSFTVENIGAPESELNWEIDTYPDWGTWTFTPDSGTGLTPEDDPVTIEVEVVAPDEEEQTFTGSIKIVNIDDTTNYCTIDASLVTPVPVSHSMPFLQWFMNRHPIIAEILGF